MPTYHRMATTAITSTQERQREEEEEEDQQQQPQADETTTSPLSWPLSNICEPHDTNDVLLLPKVKTGILDGQYPFQQQKQQPICYNKSYIGNERFLQLLKERLDDYKLKSSMEKPMIAVELLKEWRLQKPPGRFLVAISTEDKDNSPLLRLWKDVGDKEARSRISKTLKNFCRQQSTSTSPDYSTSRTSSTASSSSTTTATVSATLTPPTTLPVREQQQQLLVDSDIPIQRSVHVQEDEELLKTSSPPPLPPDPTQQQQQRRQQQQSSTTSSSPSSIPTPTPAPTLVAGGIKNISKNIARPHKLQSRRISAQLHATIHQQGKLYGRYKEQELMWKIYNDTTKAIASTSTGTSATAAASAVPKHQPKINVIVIKGPRGVGKSALARTFKNQNNNTNHRRSDLYHVSDDDDDDDDQDDIEQQHSSSLFYLETKFEQLRNPNPYRVFVNIANQICLHMLKLQQQQQQQQQHNGRTPLQQFQTRLKETFSLDDLDILMDLIPLLRQCLVTTNTGFSDDSQQQQQQQQQRTTTDGTGSGGGGILLTQKVKSYFMKFLQVTMSINTNNNNNNKPIVVVLNDMHWASEASLDIWTSILSDIVAIIPNSSSTKEETQTNSNGCGIIFVATVHEEDSTNTDDAAGKQQLQEQQQQQQQTPQHFAKAIEKLQQQQTTQQMIRFYEIRLKNLQENDVRDFLVDTLDTSYDKVKGLASHIYSLSDGNPMFVTTMLPRMQNEGFIYPDTGTGEWSYDMAEIKSFVGDVKSVFDLIRSKFTGLVPPEVQLTLKYASSLGHSQIDTSILELLLLQPESSSPTCNHSHDNDQENNNLAKSHLEMAVEFGFINKQRQGSGEAEGGGGDGSCYYYFPIDGIRHTIYTLIPETERPAFHLSIAQKLWKHLDDRDDDNTKTAAATTTRNRQGRSQQQEQEDETEFLYILLNQLMLGDCILKENSDRHAVATLCLRGGKIAAKTLGFQTAWVYLEHGISVLPPNKLWGRENYDLSLQLHNAAVEVCYCNAKFDLLDELIDTILKHSRVLEDSLVARSTQIFALGSRHKLTEAVTSALGTLKELGEVRLPASPTSSTVARCYRKTEKLLQGRTDESILHMESMTDKKKLSVLQIYNHMFLYASYSKPSLAALVAMRMVQLTLESGISNLSCVAFSYYAEFLVGGRCIEEGLRWGKLGMKLYGKFKNEAWLPRVYCCYYGVVIISKERLSKSLDPLRYAMRTGLRTGDIEYAMRSGMMWICTAMGSGTVQLPVIKTELERLAADMKLTGHTLALAMLEPIYQLVLNLSSGPDEPHRRDEFRKLIAQENVRCSQHCNVGVALWFKFAGMGSAVLFGDSELAKKSSKGVNAVYTQHGYSSIMSSMVVFFECMIRLQQARRVGIGRRLLHLSYVRRRLELLKKWAFLAPENILDKYYILAGALAAVELKVEEASLNYRAGILHATVEGRHGVAGIGNELLARFFMEQGDPETALSLLDVAENHYKEWGAKAKLAKVQKFHDSIAVGKKSD